ncbi:MAG TPA: hypothetical protein VFR05_08745, partial [Terriglobia bacterium]|nr:hypothetical protein [Terriglobia bacterium]
MTNGANSSPPRRHWRRFARRTLVTALVLAVGAVALIHTSPVQQFILRQAEVFARNAGYAFTAKRVQIKPFDLEFSLSGFQYDNRGVRVEVDELALDIPWNIYSADGIVLNSLSADGLRVTITSPEPILPEPSGETTRIPRIVVNRLAVRNGRFAYSNASTRVEVPSFEIEALSGRGTLKLRDPISIAPDT